MHDLLKRMEHSLLIIFFRVFSSLLNTRKKIINNECAILFNKTCINERLLPKYIYIYTYI